jgi:hypothetical protein
MNFSNLPSPGGVIKELLIGVFGPSAAIVAIFTIVNFALSWFGVAKSGVRLGRRSVVAASQAHTRVMGMRPAAVAIGSLITVFMLFLQIAWLWSASRISNGLSYLWNAPFGRGNPEWSGLVSYTNWGWIATLYMLASVGILVKCYIFAFGDRKDPVGGGVVLLTLPLLLPWGLLTVLGSLVSLLNFALHWLTNHSYRMPGYGWTFMVMTLLVLSYTIAVSTALNSTITIARIWRSYGGTP